MLSKEEINRYSRHILLSEIGKEGQEKLKQAKVLVVGAGGLGCPVLQYLAAAGVGTIGMVDGDVVDETNLQRQILFTSDDIGISKVVVASKKLSLLNSNCKLQAVNCKLTSVNALDSIKEYDLVIDGSDNFPTRYLVNDACVMLNKPLVFGSIFKFEGQLSVFNYYNGPTYRCLFPAPPAANEVPNCSETGVLGVLPGIIGTLMANEALKIILGIGDVLSGKLFVLDALSMNTQLVSFNKDSANSKINYLIDYESFCISPLSPRRGAGGEAMRKEISPSELQQLIANDIDFQLMDVREESEYMISNIKGDNIPLGSIEKNISKISRDKQVVVHCKAGGRSRKAIELLEEKYGFTNLYNLTGGMDAWK